MTHDDFDDEPSLLRRLLDEIDFQYHWRLHILSKMVRRRLRKFPLWIQSGYYRRLLIIGAAQELTIYIMQSEAYKDYVYLRSFLTRGDRD